MEIVEKKKREEIEEKKGRNNYRIRMNLNKHKLSKSRKLLSKLIKLFFASNSTNNTHREMVREWNTITNVKLT